MVGGLQRLVVLPLVLCVVTSYAQQPTQTATDRVAASIVSPSTTHASSITPRVSVESTCISRTINYITHRLPQQCLRTDRSSPSAPPSTRDGLHDNIMNSSSLAATSDNASASLQSESTGSSAATATPSHISSGSSASIDPPQPAAPSTSDAELEMDSLLDNSHFLSFEEWKKQNLAKAGQSPDAIGRKSEADLSVRSRPGLHNALEGLGEESEIDIDFGFGSAASTTGEVTHASPNSDSLPGESPPWSAPGGRSRDAGKTCKERTNYASFDCAATVLKTNSECKSASSILVEHKDSYMLNTCSASNKFLIVELCDDILVDTIVLANFEFFSSIFRHFRVSVSDRYPVKHDKWRDLGTFEARNTREIQAFLVETPLIWASYLRIEFLTHYGNEYYCPVSLLRVHGTTMLEEFRHHEEQPRDYSEEDTILEPDFIEVSASPIVTQVISIHEIPTTLPDGINRTGKQSTTTQTEFRSDAMTTEDASNVSSGQSQTEYDGSVGNRASHNDGHQKRPDSSSSSRAHPTHASSPTGSQVSQSEPQIRDDFVGSTAQFHPTPTHLDITVPSQSQSGIPIPSSVDIYKNSSSDITVAIVEPHTSDAQENTVALASDSNTMLGTNATKTATPPNASTREAQPQPTTQESFFKSVHKRLQQLESNSTLSLQYIEEQSRMLRDAFSKVEKRQSNTTLTFLSHLNDTVMKELSHYRQAYDQLWQGTVLELESHREQHQREMLVLSSRLTIIADELLWQKRIGMLQSTLLLLVLGLVLFTRHSSGLLEVPLLQQVMTKSHAALRTGWDSDPGSPSPTSRSPVNLLRRRVWWPDPDNEPTSDGADLSHVNDIPELSVRVDPPSPEPEVNGEGIEDSYDTGQDPTDNILTSSGSEDISRDISLHLQRIHEVRESEQ